MFHSSFFKISSALFIGISVLVVGLVFGSPKSAAAASLQNHDFGILNSADVSAYRWEASASYFMSHQSWPVQDLTTYSAADISAFRWNAMAAFYMAHPEFTSRDLTAFQNSMAARTPRLPKSDSEPRNFNRRPVQPVEMSLRTTRFPIGDSEPRNFNRRPVQPVEMSLRTTRFPIGDSESRDFRRSPLPVKPVELF